MVAVLQGWVARARVAMSITKVTAAVGNLPMEIAVVADNPKGAEEDLLPWTQNSGVRLPQWVDTHLTGEAMETAMAGEVEILPVMEEVI